MRNLISNPNRPPGRSADVSRGATAPIAARGLRPRRPIRSAGLIAAALATALAGCQTLSGGTVGSADRALAEVDRRAVASDDPLATEVGRWVLTDGGGNAADAAAAMAAVMAVTLPSRAGFAGGGMCLVYDGAANEVRTLDFLPRGADGAGAPLMLAGLTALAGEFGRLEVAAMLGPAERFARFGHPVSRGLAADLQAMAPVFVDDAAVTAVFGGPAGGLAQAGDELVQEVLADALRRIQQGGVVDLVRGPRAIGLAEAAAGVGAPLASAAGSARMRFSEPIQVEFGSDRLWVPAEIEAGGSTPALLFAALEDVRDYDDAEADERPHLMAEALARALAARGIGPALIEDDMAEPLLAGYDPGRATTMMPAVAGDTSFGASLVAFSGNYLRNSEMAVACALTMNGLFGSGRIAPDMGLFVAAPSLPGVQAIGGLAILSNPPTSQALYVGAGSDLPTALTAPLIETLLAEQPLGQAIAAPRVMPDFTSPAVLVERPALDRLSGPLEARGHGVRPAPALGRGTAIHCGFDGLLAAKSCAAAADPRGYGSAFVITR